MPEINASELALLMQAVADGEASAQQVRDLERQLAADPSARAQFAEMQRFIARLAQVGAVRPPPGLAEATLARLAAAAPHPGRWRQLLRSSRVNGSVSKGSRDRGPGTSARANRDSRRSPSSREFNMSEQQGNPGTRRNLLIGGGIALAAVILVSQYGIDFPKSGDSTTGTIVPAERYRAAQPAATDVKVESPANTQAGQALPSAQAGAANESASKAASEASSSRAASEAASSRAASEASASRAASESASKAAAEAASKASAEAASSKAASEAASKAASEAASKAAADAAMSKAAAEAASKAAAEAASSKAASEAANRAASEAAAKASSEAMKK